MIRRARASACARDGLTMVELLLALGLAALLLALLMKLLDSSLSLWQGSENRREFQEMSAAALELLAADLASLEGGARGDLVAEWQLFDADGDGFARLPMPALRMVRWAGPEETDRIRGASAPAAGAPAAGSTAAGATAAGAPVAMAAPGAGAAGTRVALIEVCWILLPAGAPRPGEPVEPLLWRGERLAGAAGSLSFLDPSFLGRSGRPPAGVLEELTGGVLWMEVLFAASTTDLGKGWRAGTELESCAASWDAWGRGRPAADRFEGNEPHPGISAAHDRAVLPRRARAAIELERPDDRKRRTHLSADLDLREAGLAVDDGLRLPSPGTMVLVDEEWMKITAVNGNRASALRGQRGTPASVHKRGALVRFGSRFEREVPIAQQREDWGL